MSSALILPLLDRLSPAGRQRMEQGLIRHRLPQESAVVAKGDAVSGAYFVLSGRLRVFTLTPGGKEATLYRIDPGETCVLALNSLFNDLLYPAWVVAEQPTELAVAPGPLYRALFRSEPAIQDLTVQSLSVVVLRLMTELEDVHSHRVDQRLASFLLNNATADGVLRTTQQAMAGQIGTSREMVARVMGDFVRRSWVESGRGRVRICAPHALAALLDQDAG